MPIWSKAPKSLPFGEALHRSFRRPSGGVLCFAQGDVANFSGDVLATSTSQGLEGVQRADWWGFAGRSSADAALHLQMKGLAEECQKQRKWLDFGEVMVTHGAHSFGHLLHTAIPSHPSSRDPASMPANVGSPLRPKETAESLLHKAFTGLLQAASDLGATSFCCPSLGCGCRGFPVDRVARIGLEVFASSPEIPYIEVRCTQRSVLEAWIQKTSEFDFEECAE
eukprot:Skav229410  [mRNA]  locus=scaffold2297:80465:81913:+ [translate_table: standard]